ncbi:hypothetical protein CDL12_07247 [Handroanthus impetiginosus]|uniref:Pentacotripeptide-repeat region of PRORP domain-containing protein n=1 Tax=Handroanthus impetiginosus TaxID=429701 RepID=A0A2G9HRD2_9LAMI|nr:hypothetical protein CDL12_07247 [Handroanthus impetiginosus]
MWDVQIHASIITSDGQELAFAVASKLTSLYIQFNDFVSSVSVLKGMKEPNTFLWNSVIKAHVNAGLSESAFSAYKLMREDGVSCDGYTFPILSKLVLSVECGVSFAEMIHCLALGMGFESDVYFCNTLIDSYAKSGCLGNALKLFDKMLYRDLVSWTSMISAFVSEGNANRAFGLFNEMRKELEPNEVTMIVMLQSCSNIIEGRQFHGYVIKCGSLMDQSLKNSILKMYADFGNADDSENLFEETGGIRDVVSWNIMIHLYSSQGKTMKIVDCLSKLRNEVEPSIETLTLLISALGEDRNHTQDVQHIHCLALKSGLFDNILMTSLLDLYAKCGDLENSTKLFIEVSQRNYTTRVAVIRNFLSVPNESTRSLQTSILNMYVRCGDISSARNCFDTMLEKDLVTYSSMIEGYGTHGLGAKALEIFHMMTKEGIEPSGVTFLNLLSACSHSGLLREGCKALNSMQWEFGIEPDLDHYTCMVDLLGRSGKVKEALSIILKLVASPDSLIWAALLAAARVYEDQRVGKYAAEKLFDLESDNAGYYTLLSNVQASGERWDEVQEVRSVMQEMNLIKYPGWSCLEVKGNVHGFVSGDRSHF